MTNHMFTCIYCQSNATFQQSDNAQRINSINPDYTVYLFLLRFSNGWLHKCIVRCHTVLVDYKGRQVMRSPTQKHVIHTTCFGWVVISVLLTLSLIAVLYEYGFQSSYVTSNSKQFTVISHDDSFFENSDSPANCTLTDDECGDIFWSLETCLEKFPGLLLPPIELDFAVPINQSDIPVYVIAYNNPTFVSNMVAQLTCYNSTTFLVNTGSTYEPLLDYFSKYITCSACKGRKGNIVINAGHESRGHIPYHWYHKVFNSRVPPRFAALTDADLAFNPFLPPNYLLVLAHLVERYQVKAGFALDLSHPELFWNDSYAGNMTIFDWESQNWELQKKVMIETKKSSPLEGYITGLDSTFAVYEPGGVHTCLAHGCLHPLDGLRVAGNFSALHIPWYRDFYKDWRVEELIACFTTKTKAGSTMAGLLRNRGILN